MPQRLVALGTTAALDILNAIHAGQHSRQPFAAFDGAPGLPRQGGRSAQDMQDLGPEPFRAIAAAFVFRIIDGRDAAGTVDFFRLRKGGMVLPQDEHGIRIFREFGQQGEGRAAPVSQARRRAGRVKAYAHNPFRRTRRAAGEGFPNRAFQDLKIVQGMLAPLVAAGVTIQALLPAGIVPHTRSEHPPVGGIDNDGPSRIGAIVQSNHIMFHIQVTILVPPESRSGGSL